MKKFLGVLLSITLIMGLLVGCGSSTNDSNNASNDAESTDTSKNAKARTLDEIKEDGKIKIGVFSDKNPFGYVDSNGDVQGYDVEFAKRIGKDLLGSEDAVLFHI